MYLDLPTVVQFEWVNSHKIGNFPVCLIKTAMTKNPTERIISIIAADITDSFSSLAVVIQVILEMLLLVYLI